uniref:Mitochondrial intermediate peptidase n=1 Tax=Bursaphelenchus xylophilus TaxID=6326 RepID=A0A1I7SLY3_BURXY
MRSSVVRRVLIKTASITNVKGMFGNEKLRCPQDFEKVTDNVIRESEMLVGEIVKPYESRKLKKPSVQLLDDLSNTICTAADLAECVRNMHPDGEYREAGNNSIYRLTDLLETLNSMPALYHSVSRSEKSEASMLDSVDKRALRLFLDDFEQCGVHLKEAQMKSAEPRFRKQGPNSVEEP